MVSQNSPILSQKTIEKLNDPSRLSYFSFPSGELAQIRIVLFVLDGLRYDAFRTEPSFSSLLSDPLIHPNSQLLKFECQLPSISIPNWLTLLTGVSPTFHGKSGNEDLSETSMDSVFREIKSMHSNPSVGRKLKSGISGENEWTRLIESHLLPYVSSGVESLSQLYGDPSTVNWRGPRHSLADKVWGQYLISAVTTPQIYRYKNASFSDGYAVRYFNYDFFLAYWLDIDSEGHNFGADSADYKNAINEKSDLFKDFLNTLSTTEFLNHMEERRVNTDERTHTVVLLTADHGHVTYGGHGAFHYNNPVLAWLESF